MIQNTKCECGHQNHVGTVLCESCGKPLNDADDNALLEMRYDGIARRSQRTNPSPVDRIWNFFSSVKIAIYLILITLCVAALGTILPQENTLINTDPSQYYSSNYGRFGHIYYLLGMSHTYNSWVFRTLLFLIAVSLVVCSLDRVLPLYRALNKQQIRKHDQFLSRQRITYQNDLSASNEDSDAAAWTAQAAALLKKKRFRVHTDANGTALLAEKNRFSRWGPYINHIGLIIFLGGALMRGIPGWYMDQYVGFLEGVPTPIPHTEYYLQDDNFNVQFYTKKDLNKDIGKASVGTPKLYATKATLYRCTAACGTPDRTLKAVTTKTIHVNDPLVYKGIKAYQFDYRITPQLLSVDPQLKNTQSGQVYGRIHLDLHNVKEQYKAGPYQLHVSNYFPDFTLNKDGKPGTKSNKPNEPAFVFRIKGPNLPAKGIIYMYFALPKDKTLQDTINASQGNRHLSMDVGNMQHIQMAQYTSYLNIRVDRAMPFIWFGAAISMIGLVLGFYWQHRRIWLRLDNGRLLLGAHTNKNWYGIRQEVAAVLRKTGFEVDSKSLDQGGKKH